MRKMQHRIARCGYCFALCLSILFFLNLLKAIRREGTGTTRRLFLDNPHFLLPSIKQESLVSMHHAYNQTTVETTTIVPSRLQFWKELVKPRAFDPWSANLPLPCFPPDGIMTTDKVQVPHNSSVSQGFFFLKTFKTASSTSAGVNLRIARNVARRLQEKQSDDVNDNATFDFCQARFDHGQPWHRHGATLFGNRTIFKSFLWAILRHPTQRAVSQFFHFAVSRKGQAPTDENFLRTMQKDKKNYYIQSLSLKRFFKNKDDGFLAANQIIRDYDFIGVTERIDESFVALAMILRIPLGDVLYLSAKSNGGYDGQCVYIQPSFISPAMQRYFDSPDWAQVIQEDLALYQAANRSLDLTIDRLGRAEFETNLANYRQALLFGQERCAPTAVFPCSKNGHPIKRTSCLWKDSGCGASCLDRVAVEFGIDRI